MNRWVIDTNVPIVANGRADGWPACCRAATIRFLTRVLNDAEHVLIDLAGEIVREYRRHLHPSGQPGVGDRFFRAVLQSGEQIERIELCKRPDGEYADLPQALIDARFDPSDRKFAALAKREEAPIVNATDSDWTHARAILAECGISVKFLCGERPAGSP